VLYRAASMLPGVSSNRWCTAAHCMHARTHASVGMYSLIHRMVIRETDSWGPVDKVAPTYFTVVGPIQTCYLEITSLCVRHINKKKLVLDVTA
jgi:hypothetical protein